MLSNYNTQKGVREFATRVTCGCDGVGRQDYGLITETTEVKRARRRKGIRTGGAGPAYAQQYGGEDDSSLRSVEHQLRIVQYDWVQATKFDTSIMSSEVPINGHLGLVPCLGPLLTFLCQGLYVWYSPAQTLPSQRR
jgi:hypothetical protein